MFLLAIFGAWRRGCKVHAIEVDETGREVNGLRFICGIKPKYNYGNAGSLEWVTCKRCLAKMATLEEYQDYWD